jgi:hypothetical protein
VLFLALTETRHVFHIASGNAPSTGITLCQTSERKLDVL